MLLAARDMPERKGLSRSRSGTRAASTASQTARNVSCALALPPAASPEASATALTAPALVPLIQPNSTFSFWRSWSSTPQVKAPCAPPPCRARLMRRLFDKRTAHELPTAFDRSPWVLIGPEELPRKLHLPDQQDGAKPSRTSSVGGKKVPESPAPGEQLSRSSDQV